MKGLEIEAIYENGALKLPRPLPLSDGQAVMIVIQPPGGIVGRGYGLLQSTRSPDDLQQIALDPELGILESP